MKAIKFEKDGQSIWSNELADGRTFSSVCVQVDSTVLNLETLVDRNERSMVWLKSDNTETLAKTQEAVIKQINTGVLSPYRAFSETPFYEGQSEDINPQTEQPLGRYSEVRLCPSAKHATLHRQFVVTESIVTSQAQPAIKLAETEA